MIKLNFRGDSWDDYDRMKWFVDYVLEYTCWKLCVNLTKYLGVIKITIIFIIEADQTSKININNYNITNWEKCVFIN